MIEYKQKFEKRWCNESYKKYKWINEISKRKTPYENRWDK